MIVIQSRPNLSNEERGEEKLKLTLLWVGEWAFSTVELLSARLGQKPSATSLFFKKLIKSGYLVRFNSAVYSRKDLVRIGPKGRDYLLDHFGVDVTRHLRSDELGRKKKIIHDYHAQIFAASVERHYASVHSELSIVRQLKTRKPDALISLHPIEGERIKYELVEPPEDFLNDREGENIDPSYFWLNEFAPEAVEYEGDKKNQDAVKGIFRAYFYLMLQGKVSAVHFVFPTKSWRDSYQKYFDQVAWSHKIKIVPEHPIRERFTFLVMNPEEVLTGLLAPRKWIEDYAPDRK